MNTSSAFMIQLILWSGLTYIESKLEKYLAVSPNNFSLKVKNGKNINLHSSRSPRKKAKEYKQFLGDMKPENTRKGIWSNAFPRFRWWSPGNSKLVLWRGLCHTRIRLHLLLKRGWFSRLKLPAFTSAQICSSLDGGETHIGLRAKMANLILTERYERYERRSVAPRPSQA